MSEITILHLSDIHFKKEKADENKDFRQLVQQNLIETIKAHVKAHGNPDVVVITGDIAFSGKKNEYDAALDFFKELKAVLPEKTEFLPVPGNHDVDRDRIRKRFSLYRVVNENQVDEFLGDKHDVKDFVNVKFKAFRDFARKLNSFLYKDAADYFWVRNLGKKNVSFLGLNSAWASEGDEDRFNIALGYRQVLAALDKSKGIPNRILLMHHPLFEWLKDRDMGKCRGEIFDRCGLILHGHVHFDSAARISISTPSDTCICLGANASYTHDGYIGFQFIRAHFQESTDSVQVRVLPYILDARERPAFFPDTRRWEGQKGETYFEIKTQRSCGVEEEDILRPLHVPAQYRDWVMQFHSRMDTQQLDPNAKAFQVPLPELYIPIETANPFHKPTTEDDGLLKEKGKKMEMLTRKEEDDEAEEGKDKEPAFIDIEELLGRKECILLRGPAGMGKTTLIKHLSYTITQGGGPVSLCGYLPVVVFLKDFWPLYEKELTEDKPGTGINFLFLLNIYLQTRVDTLDPEVVGHFLSRHRALFLIDGLDEVPEHFRPGLVELIAAFRVKHKKNRFLLTGRPHGIDAVTKAHFGQYLRDIEPLDKKKIEEFIHKWFRVVTGQAVGLAKVTAAEMIGDIEVNEHVKIFTRNPLLLTAVSIYNAVKSTKKHEGKGFFPFPPFRFGLSIRWLRIADYYLSFM